MSEIIYLNPNEVVFIQSRAEVEFTTVDEYAAMMTDGIEFDPAQGIRDEGQVYVWDGYHRGEAAKKAGKDLTIQVEPGTKADAEWLALAANQKHGLRRTNRDKRRAVELALQHPKGVELSDREIARHCGVHNDTVGRIRKELELSVGIRQIEARTVTRNGQTYQQNTANIGGKTQNTANIGKQPSSAFECPRCKQKQVSGYKSRTCLNCGATWPDSRTFFQEYNSQLGTDSSEPAPQSPASIAYPCRYWRCQADTHRKNKYTVPGETLTCTVCGAKHTKAMTGIELSPGEHDRLELLYRKAENAKAKKALEQRIQAVTLGSSTMFSRWTCEHCHSFKPSGSHYTIVQLGGESRRVCDECLPQFHVEETPPPNGNSPHPVAYDFTCPRCGQRTAKVNGGAICLNEACQAKWTTRAEYDAELEAYEEDLNAPPLEIAGEVEETRRQLKTQVGDMIDTFTAEELEHFADWLADVKSWLTGNGARDDQHLIY